MSEVKPLSDEQLAILRQAAAGELHDYGAPKIAENMKKAGWLTGSWPPEKLLPSPIGAVCLATITNERQQAAEGERRRIDGLADQLADHTQDLIAAAPREKSPDWTLYGLHDNEDGTTGVTFTEALEAAANSLNKEQTNG